MVIFFLANDTAIDQTDEMVADLYQGHEAEAHAESHDAPDIGDGVNDGGVLVNLDPCGERFPDEHRQDGGVVLGILCQSSLEVFQIKVMKLLNSFPGPDFVCSTEKVVLLEVLDLLTKALDTTPSNWFFFHRRNFSPVFCQ